MKAKEWFQEAERFVRSYTEGMRESEFSRLFERDAARAFDVVTREHDREKEPKDEFWRFLHRVRIFFLGLFHPECTWADTTITPASFKAEW